MSDVVLDSLSREEASAEPVLDFEESTSGDDLEAARGVFWWSLASVVLWGLIALAFG